MNKIGEKLEIGFKDLNLIIKGINQGELVIVGGRPGMGKTAFALSMMLKNDIQDKNNIVYFSLELSYSQVLQKLKLIDIETHINELEKGKLFAKEIELMNIDACGFIFISELENKIIKYVSEKRVELIIIDYLQLITVEDGKSKRNNYQKNSIVIEQLMKLSIELGISIIILSQLSRNCDLRFDWERRPCLTDLTMSKKYIDKILLLFRPEYYKMTNWDDEEAALTFDQAEIIVAKNNNGNLGSARLHFISYLGKFENLTQN